VAVPRPPLASSSDTNIIKFVLVAPHASNVAVVGDFNDWDAKATPMTRTKTGGTWSVAIKLPAGRHVYAFVVNGANGSTQWVADPTAPLAPEDGLGAPNSVVLVGGSSS
ncbi:MAG TPA: isoamylase early set domain-containing protein, partial [Gemmatimonadaceae bacterium]|nr:isoamylase early set domain-containing protein [Gemmatimonadaceae bacterium]